MNKPKNPLKDDVLGVEAALHVVTVPLSARPTLSSYTGKMDTWYRV